jgi:small subunit ribosomal protein S21
MIIVKVKGNKIEYALKSYRKKLKDIGVHQELRERKRFKKKSVKKREELNKAVYNRKKDEGQEFQ